jgi:hypothetical protein
MTTTGDVQITILDNAGSSIPVNAQTVQVVIGCSSSGTVATPVATRSIATLQSTYGKGPLVEAAALAIAAGATVIAVRATSASPGSTSAVVFAGTGTSVITASVGTAYDEAYVKFVVVTGGTIGVAGITYKVSFDAGKTYGPVLALGTANTLALTGLGITLAFAAGTLVAGDAATMKTTAPTWDTSGVQACLTALQASPYAVSGWGSMHLVGICTGANAATIGGYLNTMATGYLFNRLMVSARDASPATAYSGTGESDATWSAAVIADFASNAVRIGGPCCGYYPTPSAIADSQAGTPRYRRSATWSWAVRQTQIAAQTLASKVSLGSLSTIVVDPSLDPLDGFVYHDERINPVFSAARLCGLRTRVGLGVGYYMTPATCWAAPGSDFALFPKGLVMDVACGTVHTTGQQVVDSDVRLNSNGTIYENDAGTLESKIGNALAVAMNGMVSQPALVVVNRTNNIAATGVVLVTVTIYARGYILEIDVTLQYNNTLAS